MSFQWPKKAKQYKSTAGANREDGSPRSSGEFEEVDLGDPRYGNGSSRASSSPKDVAPPCPSTSAVSSNVQSSPAYASTSVTVGNVQFASLGPSTSVKVDDVQVPLSPPEKPKKISFLQRLKRLSCEYFAGVAGESAEDISGQDSKKV